MESQAVVQREGNTLLMPFTDLRDGDDFIIGALSVGGKVYAIGKSRIDTVTNIRNLHTDLLEADDLGAVLYENRDLIHTPRTLSSAMGLIAPRRASDPMNDRLAATLATFAKYSNSFRTWRNYDNCITQTMKNAARYSVDEGVYKFTNEAIETIYRFHAVCFPTLTELNRGARNPIDDGFYFAESSPSWSPAMSAATRQELAELTFGDHNKDRVKKIVALVAENNSADADLVQLRFLTKAFGPDLLMEYLEGRNHIRAFDALRFDVLQAMDEEVEALSILPRSAAKIIISAMLLGQTNSNIVVQIAEALQRRTKFKPALFRSAKNVEDILRFALRYAKPRAMDDVIPEQLLSIDGSEVAGRILRICTDETAIADAAKSFKNCLLEGDYFKKIMDGDSFIATLWEPDGEPFACVELVFNRHSIWKIMQIFGVRNTAVGADDPEDRERVVDGILELLSDENACKATHDKLKKQGRFGFGAHLDAEDAVAIDLVNIQNIVREAFPVDQLNAGEDTYVDADGRRWTRNPAARPRNEANRGPVVILGPVDREPVTLPLERVEGEWREPMPPRVA